MFSGTGTEKKPAPRPARTYNIPVSCGLSPIAGAPPVPASSEGHLSVSRPYQSSKPLSWLAADRCPSLTRLLAEC
jgi:hypothetical protein